VCSKEADEKSTYCELHAKAYENILCKHNKWKKALENITWKDYLNKIIKNPLTGESAKEVALQLLAEEATRNKV
jgi:hypothetical protein